MPEEKVTEEKVTEEEGTEGKIYEVDSGKLVTLHGLLAECIKLARETLEDEFGDLASVKGGSLGKLTCDLAIALFNKVSVPDQTETMLAALERGLEWYGRWQEEQKAESEKISADFQKSISAVLPRPTRRATPLEVLMRNLIDFASRFSEVELTKLSDEVEEAKVEKPIETFTQEKGSPTPEE